MVQAVHLFAGASALIFLGAVLFLVAAVERHRAAREASKAAIHMQDLFDILLDHTMASGNADGFAAVERRRAAKRRMAEAAKEKAKKKPPEIRWAE